MEIPDFLSLYHKENTKQQTLQHQQIQMADRRIRSTQQSNDAKQTAINFAQDAAVDAQKAAGAQYFLFMFERLSTSLYFTNLLTPTTTTTKTVHAERAARRVEAEYRARIARADAVSIARDAAYAAQESYEDAIRKCIID